ncbi:MAG: MerR family transcriptional regulator [Microcystis sp. M038S2]|jgi:DNA-binding transcriptional MerR regulator|uniref:MerR family transcriptional regulator n=1 Tax=unclassified Microcystis TaxID=2643300 RepID=UPI001197DE02|nr:MULTISPECIES: MerR family transcriptional regulator [unclassified Microcystis]NCQ68835.1 MerR family transcriptional regulator [Microcystis aeruginosa W13-16]NCQ73367.1 MerR family transcriptional regulator [Microcystis aeruginosa W13-13]NCQ77862.1 MerR family transcriptional regulator [Microcystis aeruginosa W13-15]NCR11618.1 MerR family transcriptional regulator [Microcystis aeruginosa SX13-11]NCR16490.1 MerR family transcriptional regulator [Microcystis aeruginosa LL13-03]NCR21528.1 Mer
MLKIGQLSRESGVSIKTIRYYEELGLIQSPERTEGQFRLFTPDTVHRLLFVKRLQSLGLSLQESRECLVIHDHGELPCGDIQEKLIKHIAEIDQQVEQLLLLRQQLTETLQVWTDTPVKDDQFICPNLKV